MLNRVGINGYSWGGYFALRAMLLAPDVYQVGVAGAGSITDGIGPGGDPSPVLDNKAAYEYASNLSIVGNLKGKLLLIQGASDRNVEFSSTMKIANALTKAGKFFDLIVMPEENHVSAGTSAYTQEAVRRYFQEHLKP